MSLIHWWPLNGDLKDYGISNNVLKILYGTPTFTAGKIGQCANLVDGQAYYISDSMKCNSVTGYSVAAWVKFDSLTSSNRCGIWSNKSGGPVFSSCEIYDNKLHYYHYNSAWQSTFGNTTLTAGTWYHIVFVIVNRTVTFYLNGVQDGTGDATLSGDNQNLCDSVGCSWTSSYSLRGYLNDVRIYDHALSVKEVKELSKGLVLHYDFNDPYVEATTNLDGARGYAMKIDNQEYNVQFTPSKWGNADGYIINRSNEGYGNMPCSEWHKTAGQDGGGFYSWLSRGFALTAGHTYTASVYVWSNKVASTNGYICSVNSSTLGNYYIVGNGFTLKPGWQRLSHTFTVASDKTATDYCYSPLIYTNPDSGEWIVKLSGFQIEEKDHATAFTNSTRSVGKIFDCSGYGYNAEVVYNPPYVLDSGSGKYCVDLTDNTTKGYYDLGTATLNFLTNGTVCFWAKYTDTNNKMLFGSNDAGERYFLANTPNSSSSSGAWYSSRFSQGTAYCDGEVYNKPKCDSQWHFYTFTGVNASNWGDYKYFLCKYANVEYNSFQFHGYLADLKIYATALSADDILAEYQRKASIDKSGILFTGEFVEGNNTNIDITKTAIVGCNNIVEGASNVKMIGGYTQLEYIESTGTQYIDTGIVINNNYEFILEEMNNFDTNNHYMCGSSGSAKMLGTLNNALWSNGILYSNVTFNRNTKEKIGFKVVTDGSTGSDYLMRNYTTNAKHSGRSYFIPTGSGTVKLFSHNGSTKESFKCYDFKLFKDDMLVSHLIPVKRNSDNVLGMYDLVNKSFLTNAGSGTFTAGPEISNISAIYANEIKEI